MYVATSAIGGLMHEHQLILRVVRDMRLEFERISAGGDVDPAYVVTVVDFIRTYADRCHHGKEEDILFRDLAGKQLSDEDRECDAAPHRGPCLGTREDEGPGRGDAALRRRR